MKLAQGIRDTRKTVTSILVLILCAAAIFFAGMLFAKKETQPEITSTSLMQQLQEIEDMTVLEYNYTKVGKFENSLELNGWSIPLTKKSFLLTYSGKLSAGIDMSQIEINISDQTLTLLLPDIQILSNLLDEESIEVYDETKNIFNPISINDYKAFALQQKARVEEEAIENGFLSEAANRVKTVMQRFLEMMPNIDRYTIEFEFKK